MEIPRAVIGASASIDCSLVWNFHMSWAAMDVSDWLLQLAVSTVHASQQTISFHSSVMADKVTDGLANRILELEQIEQTHGHKQDRFIAVNSEGTYKCAQVQQNATTR